MFSILTPPRQMVGLYLLPSRSHVFRCGSQNSNRHDCVKNVDVFSSHLFWTSRSLCVPPGATQEEGHTEFIIHLSSAERALIFPARRIHPFLSLVDREVEFCVLTIGHLFFFFFSVRKTLLPRFELTSQRVRRLRG